MSDAIKFRKLAGGGLERLYPDGSNAISRHFGVDLSRLPLDALIVLEWKWVPNARVGYRIWRRMVRKAAK